MNNIRGRLYLTQTFYLTQRAQRNRGLTHSMRTTRKATELCVLMLLPAGRSYDFSVFAVLSV